MRVPTFYGRDVEQARDRMRDVAGSGVGSDDNARDAALAEERARAAQKLRLAINRAADNRNRDAGGMEQARRERVLAMIEPATDWRERDTEQAAHREDSHEDDGEDATGERDDTLGEGNIAQTDHTTASPGAPALLPPPQRALREGEGDGGQGAQTGASPDVDIDPFVGELIAASFAPPALPAPAALRAEAPAPARADAQARIDNIAARVETAWRAQYALRPNETIRLQLKLDAAEAGGFDGLSVAISATALDVTLMGLGGVAAAPSAALIEAALALARRLHRRFPDRVVRIIGAAEEESTATDGLDALSRILRGAPDEPA
jgi:hypothetical protein